ncbi:hypothetical protein BX600DRAFT_474893 [Xylariales sp. PMI_506]|nr:hypothetical protein BX600DRAFT_474893 [Xylariales sp. PMI_506]
MQKSTLAVLLAGLVSTSFASPCQSAGTPASINTESTTIATTSTSAISSTTEATSTAVSTSTPETVEPSSTTVSTSAIAATSTTVSTSASATATADCSTYYNLKTSGNYLAYDSGLSVLKVVSSADDADAFIIDSDGHIVDSSEDDKIAFGYLGGSGGNFEMLSSSFSNIMYEPIVCSWSSGTLSCSISDGSNTIFEANNYIFLAPSSSTFFGSDVVTIQQGDYVCV